jgi:hypothetical protein
VDRGERLPAIRPSVPAEDDELGFETDTRAGARLRSDATASMSGAAGRMWLLYAMLMCGRNDPLLLAGMTPTMVAAW